MKYNTPEEYEQARQARYERLRAAADRAQTESDQAWSTAREMSDVIPMGQPILIGHHSEGRDRNYRARIDSKMRRGWDLHHKADALNSRARAALENQAIFSDDPAAVEKLEERIARLEKRQELMRTANQLVRTGDRAGLAELGFTEPQIAELLKKDFAGRIGFPDYKLANNSNNIRRLKARAAEVEAIQARTGEKVTELGPVRIVENYDMNRLQMFFPGKPAESVRSELKSHGFKWAPSEGAWQRFITPDSIYWANEIAKKL